ncbi:hypothetical protein HH308_28180 [Gordonia sp. TBRC 11910]|uniref:Htaa domain-containing protein n=1 Tax=Gordonia asplenii TaxID=2725283 RepID=A0A848L802_9ACTN|nr:HtaA domain-containing protein [Gordonia asplenii]NMO05105.1 hypothetical protein [Gordonia asplenii]
MRRVALIVGGLLVVLGYVPPVSAAATPTATARIAVFAADGATPIGSAVLHPGDEVVVKGRGFDPDANRYGFPVPVPPGVPHGTFIAFGAFAPLWQPSKDAPESARAATRSAVKWALSPSALSRVPSVPFDMNRTIRQQWVRLKPDGSFVARIKTTTPKDTPRHARFGIYTYGAACADNAAQERYVPINYSTSPGPNTPKPAPRNMIWAYSPGFHRQVTTAAQGGVAASDGASVDGAGVLSFALRDKRISGHSGVLHYRGTVVAYSKFHLIEFAMADPRIVARNGRGILSMRTSTSNMNGTDAMRRIDIADVDLARLTPEGDITAAAVTFRPGLSPQALAALSVGPASPITLRS